METELMKEELPTIENKERHYKYIESKWGSGDTLLKVYLDRNADEYYIDIFAAYALGFVSSSNTNTSYDEGNKFYKIDFNDLKELKNIFKDRIFYQAYPSKGIEDKPKTELEQQIESYDNFVGKEYENIKVENDKKFSEFKGM